MFGRAIWDKLPSASAKKKAFGKKGVLKNSNVNIYVDVSLLTKLHARDLFFIKKDTLVQMFSCKFFEIYQKSYFVEHLRTVALEFSTLSI